jgi:protein TonB
LRTLPVAEDDIFQIRERHPVPDKRLPPVGPPNRPAKAIGDSNLITSDDYPREAVRTGERGSVRIYYRISQDGLITACRVLQSSGSGVLDRTSCDLFMERARYQPATDAEGRPVKSFSNRTISWRNPHGD